MLLIVAILGVGLLLGWGLRGSLRNLADVRVRLWWMAPAALALQVMPFSGGEGSITRWLPLSILLFSYLLLIIVVGANRRLRGFGMILLGLTMNLTVIAANQGMPVSEAALERVGHPEDVQELREAGPGAKHRLEGEDDVLTPLADVIAVRDPFSAIVSIGDVLAYSGAAVFLGSAMLGRATRAGRELQDRPSPTTTSS